MQNADASEIKRWLEWAASRLIALPGQKIGPADPGVAWPDFSQEKFQVLEFRGNMSIRAMAPNKDEIEMMDEILLLPNLCSSPPIRRTVHARSIVHPITYRHLYPWSRIARLLNVKSHTVKYWYTKGIKEVTDNVQPDVVCRISAFMQTRL